MWKATAAIFVGLLINAALVGAGADADVAGVQEPPRRPFAPVLIEGEKRFSFSEATGGGHVLPIDVETLPVCEELQDTLAQQFYTSRVREFSLRNMEGMVPARIIPHEELIGKEFRGEGRVQVHEVADGEGSILIFEIGFYKYGNPQPHFFLFEGTAEELKARLAKPKSLWAALQHGNEGFTGLFAKWGDAHFYGRAGRIYFYTNSAYTPFELFRFSPENNVERLCTVRLLPDGAAEAMGAIAFGGNQPEGSQIGPLMRAFLRDFMQIYGAPVDYHVCGRQGSRLDAQFRDQIKTRLIDAFYRPWRVFGDGVSPDFAALARNPGFEGWSTQGLWERRVYRNFRDAPFDRIAAELAARYRAAFGYDRQTARALAARNLYEIAAGFPFGHGYDHYWKVQSELQAMILRGAPLADVAARHSAIVVKIPEAAWAEEIHPLLLVSAGRPEVTKLLLDTGADPDAANAFGKTALMHAAQENDLESARLLIEAGADVNAATDGDEGRVCPALAFDGRTALMYAAENARAPLVDMLLKAGADPSERAVKRNGEPAFTAADRLAFNPNLSEEVRAALAQRME